MTVAALPPSTQIRHLQGDDRMRARPVIWLAVLVPPVGVPLLALEGISHVHRAALDVFACAVIDAGLVPDTGPPPARVPERVPVQGLPRLPQAAPGRLAA